MRVDVHQHLYGEALVGALARRVAPPRVRRRGASWWLELDREPPSPIDIAGEDPVARAALVAEDGLDRALISLSAALGVEMLPPDEAAAVLSAYHAELLGLPEAFRGFGALALSEPDPDEVDRLLDFGAVGISLPASALADPRTLDASGPLLERIERRGAPLFVHPGPATSSPQPQHRWWPALNDYVAQMNAAWHAFIAAGRPAHPSLRVIFALLAGGAPLHIERLAARGGPAARALDPLIFYDSSSYGTRTLDAVIRVVGVDQVVFGSDRPVASPAAPELGAAVATAMRVGNPARALSGGAAIT